MDAMDFQNANQSQLPFSGLYCDHGHMEWRSLPVYPIMFTTVHVYGFGDAKLVSSCHKL